MDLRLHTTIAALAATALIAGLASTASAASGTVNLTVAKGGFVIGGSSGTGTLRFKRRTYPLVISGMSGGFTFGGSEARLTGRIANIRRPTDIEGCIQFRHRRRRDRLPGTAVDYAQQRRKAQCCS